MSVFSRCQYKCRGIVRRLYIRRRATRSLLELEGCTWGYAWLSLALVTGVDFANTGIRARHIRTNTNTSSTSCSDKLVFPLSAPCLQFVNVYADCSCPNSALSSDALACAPLTSTLYRSDQGCLSLRPAARRLAKVVTSKW